MNDRYLCADGNTDQLSILLPLGTKDYDKGLIKADQMLNDMLSAITFTIKKHDDMSKQYNPNFIKSLKQIEKQIWKCLK